MAFAARVRSPKKGTLSERGKSEATDVREGNAAAKTETSLAPGEDTLERRVKRVKGVARGVVEWIPAGLFFLGRLAGVEAGRRANFGLPDDFATASGAAKEVGGGVAARSTADTGADGLSETKSR